MNSQKKVALLVTLTVLLAVNVQCSTSLSDPVSNALSDAGIQISYSESSFINIFDGIDTILETHINDENFSYEGKLFSLSVSKINLAEIVLNKQKSSTKFISNDKMRVILNFEDVLVQFSYVLSPFNFIKLKDEGYFKDSNLQVALDLQITSNPTGSTKFKITRFDLKTGNLQTHLNNKFFNIVLKVIAGLTDLVLAVFRGLIDIASQIIVNNLSKSIPTQVKIPSSQGVLDLSVQGQTFVSNGFMNIPISGNSYIFGSTPAPLNPHRKFDPSLYGNSTQIFLDETVVSRIIQTFITSNLIGNVTLPEVVSSTTPVDSRSLSPVFVGLRKLKAINYPIIEAILNPEDIKFAFENNQLKAKVTAGFNLYMQEANKPETCFKYNINPFHITLEVGLDIINSKNFLTINTVSVDIRDLVVSPEDASLVNKANIIPVLPFFDQIVHDVINMITYKDPLNLSKLLGFDIDRVDINFNDDYIHLGLVF